jgi:hypothetical protein
MLSAYSVAGSELHSPPTRVHARGSLVQKVGETVDQALPGDEVPGFDERDGVLPWSMTSMTRLCFNNTLGVIF